MIGFSQSVNNRLSFDSRATQVSAAPPSIKTIAGMLNKTNGIELKFPPKLISIGFRERLLDLFNQFDAASQIRMEYPG